jgi:hypothetical protein
MADRGTIIIEVDKKDYQIYLSLSECHWGVNIYSEVFKYLECMFIDKGKYISTYVKDDPNYFIHDFILQFSQSEGLWVSTKLDDPSIWTDADEIIVINFNKQIVYNYDKSKWLTFAALLLGLNTPEQLESYLNGT